MVYCSFMQIILISHIQATARKSLMDVRDPFANLEHECKYQHFRPMLPDVQPSASMPIDYRHAFLMTREMMFRYVVGVQFVASCPTSAPSDTQRSFSFLCTSPSSFLGIASTCPLQSISLPLPQISQRQSINGTPPEPSSSCRSRCSSGQTGMSGLFVYCRSPMISVQTLFVAPRPKRTSSIAKRIKNPTRWTRCILFICCVSIPPDADDACDTNNAQDTGGHQ